MSADQRTTAVAGMQHRPRPGRNMIRLAGAAHEHVPVPVCCRVAAASNPARQAGGTSSHYSEPTDAIIERVSTCLEYRDPEGWRSPPAPRTTLPFDKQDLHHRQGRRPPPAGQRSMANCLYSVREI